MRRGIKSANCNSAHQPLLSASMKSRNKTDATNRASVVSETEPLCVGNQLQNIFAPTDSKLAMKLFGSKKALMKERVRQKEIGHWIIHPCSSFRLITGSECQGFLLIHNPLQVLLGPLHAATLGGEPDHLAGRHLLLQ